MLLHVVKETDAGIVVRGAKYETAAAYANQAFTKPTIANWGNSALFGLRGRLHLRPRLAEPEVHLPHRLRRPRAGRRLSARQPLRRGRHAGHLRRRADPLGERAVLPAHQGRDLHPLDAAPLLAFAFVQRNLKLADMMIGAALFNVRQTGLDKQQAVQEKLAQLAVLPRRRSTRI